MANSGSENFYRSLRASTRFKPAAETDALYKAKLARWRMTGPQWERCLDELLTRNHDGGLPELSEIYDVIKSVQLKTENSGDLGWCTFELEGIRKAIRVKSVDGRWMRMEFNRQRDIDYPFGKLTATGSYVEVKVPEQAENVKFAADKPTDRSADNLELREEIQRHLRLIGKPMEEM